MNSKNKWACRLGFLLAVSLVPASCKKEDENAPVIDHVYINGDQDHHLHANAGVSNTFEILLTDNGDLSQLKIQFISPSGFHSHEDGEDISAVELTFQSPNIGRWDTLAIYNASGSQLQNVYAFNLPDTISGGWTMRIGAIDDQGNVAQEDYTLHVYNEDLPKILADSILPAANEDGIVELNLNQTVALYGDFVDLDGITKLECTILQSGDTTWTQTIADVNNWTAPMEQFIIPPFTTEGYYLIHLHMWDTVGWTNWKQIRVLVE